MNIRPPYALPLLCLPWFAAAMPAHAGTSFAVLDDWGSGARLEVLIENDGDAPIEGWRLGFDLQQQVTEVWNGQLTSRRGTRTLIDDAGFNGTIPVGGAVAVGMIVTPGGIVTGPDGFSLDIGSGSDGSPADAPEAAPLPAPPSSPAPSRESPSSCRDRPGAVSENGKLGIIGSQLINQAGLPIQLRGMSSHGLQWFGEFMNDRSIEWLRDDWQADVVRAAMYTDPASDGYVADPSLIEKVYDVVDAAIALDMYVIVDWHILADNDPNIHRREAIDFFDRVSRRYSGIPNVIYEIANEPNSAGRGGEVTWRADIKPYAEALIPVIRANDPDSVVVVGTGTWSQDVGDAADDPLAFGNVAYAMHFYACTHGQSLRDEVSYAVGQGAAVFSTEWGTASADGGGDVCAAETRTWIDFLDGLGISWVNWSLADKDEGTAALRPGASASGGWADAELSESGRLVRQLMRRSDAR